MLMTLASSFMTATRMDGFANSGTGPARPSPRRAARTLARRALARLAG